MTHTPGCSSSGCNSGLKPCPTPTACHVPDRQYQPTFGVRGPYSRRRARRYRLRVLIAIAIAVVAVAVLHMSR
jgi:hypothetical protein